MSESKAVKVSTMVLGSVLLTIGALFIGLGIGVKVLIPALVQYNEYTTNEINQILSTWRSRHPTDPYAQTYAITPPEFYQAAMNFDNSMWIIIVFGILLSVGGELSMYYGGAYGAKPKEMVQAKVEGRFFCRYCGKENKTDATYCEGCGKKL